MCRSRIIRPENIGPGTQLTGSEPARVPSGLIFHKHEIHCVDSPLICADRGLLTRIVPCPEEYISSYIQIRAAQPDECLHPCVGPVSAIVPSKPLSEALEDFPVRRATRQTGDGKLRSMKNLNRQGSLHCRLSPSMFMVTSSCQNRYMVLQTPKQRTDGLQPCKRNTTPSDEVSYHARQ